MDYSISHNIQISEEHIQLCQTDPATLLEKLVEKSLMEKFILLPPPPPGSSEAYSRFLLFKNQSCEALLMRWQKNQYCAPHDHDGSSGYVFLLSGEFTERKWFWKNERAFVSERGGSYHSPCFLKVGTEIVHDMKANSEGISLHIYFPPIQKMRVFNVEKRETLTVSEECGAWIPQEERFVLSKIRWSENE